MFDTLPVHNPERRLAGRVLAYWNGVRGERDMPAIGEIQSEEFGPDWDYCFLADMRGGHNMPTMLHIGSVLQKASGLLISGRTNIVLDLLDIAERRLGQVCRLRQPTLVQEILQVSETERVMGRAIFVPLSEDGETVTHVLGAANGKVAPLVN